MANMTRDRLGGAFSMLMRDAEGNAETLLQMALADPRLLPMLAQNEELKNEYVANAMLGDDTKPLQEAKKAGLLTQENAFEYLKDAAMEDRFPSAAAFTWLAGQFKLPTEEVAKLVMDYGQNLDPATSAAIAKKIPLDKTQLTELLVRINQSVADMAVAAASAPVKEESSTRVARKPVPRVVDNTKFLKAVYEYQLNLQYFYERELNDTKSDLAMLKALSLKTVDAKNAVKNLQEAAESLEKELEPPTGAPLTRQQAEHYERELQSAAWFFSTYERKYGREAILHALNRDPEHNSDEAIALINANQVGAM